MIARISDLSICCLQTASSLMANSRLEFTRLERISLGITRLDLIEGLIGGLIGGLTGLGLAVSPAVGQLEPAPPPPPAGSIAPLGPAVPTAAPPSLLPNLGPAPGPVQPAVQPAVQMAPGMPVVITPDLPAIRDFDRYSPEDRTINVLLKLGHRKVYVYQGGKLLASYPVAIGRSTYPTPTGEFKVFEMIVNPAWQSPWTGEVETPGIDGSLGLRWIGFVELTGGVIGFHGTPNVGSIGQAVSHGCVRMRNEDIVKMYDLVKIGTLVRVEP